MDRKYEGNENLAEMPLARIHSADIPWEIDGRKSLNGESGGI
jgi:hypothetical protein